MTTVVTELVIDARGAAAGTGLYERAMTAAQAAVDKLLDRERALEQVVNKSDAAMVGSIQSTSRLAAAWDKLRGAADPIVKAMLAQEQAMSRAMSTTDALVRRGMVSEGDATEVLSAFRHQQEADLDRVRDAHDTVTASAKRQAAEYAELAQAGREAYAASQFQTNINSVLGVGRSVGFSAQDSAAVFAEMERTAQLKAEQIGQQFGQDLDASLIAGVAKSARDSASVFEEEFERLDEIAELKARQIGQEFQRSLNASFGIGSAGSSARDSAAVFEEAAREADQLQGRVSALRAQIDPLGTAQSRLNAELAEYAELEGRAAISTGELASAQALARSRYEATSKAIAAQQRVQKGGASNFNTANIAAQFQDIGVTAAMGMQPLQIGLQQGTQLAAVFDQLKSSGKGLGATLFAAFTSIISPVSLLTIGAVALGATAIEAFMHMQGSAKDATKALEEHDQWLQKVLTGYDSAAAAAKNASEQAKTLPKGVVTADIQSDITKNTAAYSAKIDEVAAKQQHLNELTDQWAKLQKESATQFPDATDRTERFNTLIVQADQLKALHVSAASTAPELQHVMEVAHALFLTAKEPAIKNLTTEVYDLAAGLLSTRGEINADTASLQKLQAIGDINIAVNLLGIGDALSQLKSLTPDLRTAKQKVTDIFAERAPQARSTGELQALADAAKTANAAIDAQTAQDKAEENARKLASANHSAAESYQNIIQGAQQRIAQAKAEADAVGMSADAAARLKTEQDMLNAAQNANLHLTPAQRAEIIKWADAQAEAEQKTKALTDAQAQQAAEMKQVTDTLADTLDSLFTKPITDANQFFSTILGGFASLGQSNLKKSLEDLFTVKVAANDNGVPGATGTTAQPDMTTGFSDIAAKLFGEKAGKGFGDFLKNNSGTIGAGLGGLGIGYQTQSPVMGAVGGAVSGALSGAAGGPAGMAIGAVVGGLGGLIGGLLGMNEAANKAKDSLKASTDAIDGFIATGLGKEVSSYSAAIAQFNQQGQALLDTAKQAGDSKLAAQVQKAMDAYPATLGKKFRDDLQSSLNSLKGFDALNDVSDAIDKFNQRLVDAKTLGVSAAGANEELALSLQKIASEGNITADQMKALQKQFPAFTEQIKLANLEAQKAAATTDLIDAYKAEADAQQQVIDRTKDFIKSTETFRKSLLLNSAYSTLNQQGRLTEAQSQFNITLSKARLGDADAQGQLQGSASSYLDAARGYLGSSDRYADIFNKVNTALVSVESSATGQQSNAERQLATANAQLAKMGEIVEVQKSVLELQKQIKELTAAMAKEKVKVDAEKIKATKEITKTIKGEAGKEKVTSSGRPWMARKTA